ncbi:hypothetical protein TDB9533_01289 [Thalassocella blandensis]|nr:hypothetical protein TDB9533_01289 [Thalassocella blandensis]
MALMGKRNTRQNSDEGVYTSVDSLLRLRHVAKDLSLDRRKKSTALVDGDSRTHFRGRGMEFAEVRPYQPGDDIRNIDWRVTARTQTTYTKLFQEERERPVYILVDQRAPMFFGSETQFKSVMAARIAAIIGWTALQNNDRIGGLVFSDTEQTDSKARRGKHAMLSLIHQLHTYNTQLTSPVVQKRSNSMIDMLHDLRRVSKPGSAVFIISDFHDFDTHCAEPLSILSRHSDVTCIHVYDKLESALPRQGNLTISDGQHKLTLSSQSLAFTQAFSKSFDDACMTLRKACTNSACAYATTTVGYSAEALAQDLFTHKRRRTTKNS